MSVAAGTEREFKFDVDAAFDPPDLRPTVGRTVRLPELTHRTTYFDTADHRLWSCGITLRHRHAAAGDDSGEGRWTLKLPEGPDADGDAAGRAPSERSELTWSGPVSAVPAPVLRIVAGVVRRAPLGPIAELSATRRRLLLQEPAADRAWAEIDDDLVSVESGPNAGQRFRQIEVELVEGVEPPAGQIDAVVASMRAAGATPGGASKLGLALGLPDRGVVPSSQEPRHRRPAGRRSPLAVAVRQMLSADVRDLLDQDFRLRRAGEGGVGPDVEVIHRARVAARRVRANLLTLDPVLDPVWVGHVRADLRSYGRALGQVRDADVLLDRLKSHTDEEDRDGVEELAHLVAGDRALACADLLELMSGDGYRDLLERLVVAGSTPPLYSAIDGDPSDLPAGPALHRMVRQRWRRVVTDISELGRNPDAEALHHLRIRAKRLRYAARAATPYLGPPARRTARTAKRLQDALGELHDATVAVSWLRQMASHPSVTPAAAFVAGRIAGQAEGAATVQRRVWQRAGHDLTGRKMRAFYS